MVTDGSGRIKFPINEPAQGKRKTQTGEYLDFYRGAGATVTELSQRGVEFLPIPESYYAEEAERIAEIHEDVAVGAGC